MNNPIWNSNKLGLPRRAAARQRPGCVATPGLHYSRPAPRDADRRPRRRRTTLGGVTPTTLVINVEEFKQIKFLMSLFYFLPLFLLPLNCEINVAPLFFPSHFFHSRSYTGRRDFGTRHRRSIRQSFVIHDVYFVCVCIIDIT